MLTLHNSVRRDVLGSGFDLRWDRGLESRARGWAKWLAANVAQTQGGWNGGHPGDYGGDALCRKYLGGNCGFGCETLGTRTKCFRDGQNVATFSNYSEPCIAHPESAVNAWYNEIHEPAGDREGCRSALYKSGSLSLTRDGAKFECGHFSQLLWKGAKKIGCGTAEARLPGGGSRIYHVCNYDQGNVIGKDKRYFVSNLPEACAPGSSRCPTEKPV